MNDIIKVADLSSGLSSDFEKLYDSGKYTDISINVGREPNNKIFLAHTVVLCTRCEYFETKLTGNTESSSDIQQTPMVFEDVMPESFEILLRFLYTGRLNYRSSEILDWIGLLNVTCRFGLDGLVTAVGDFLINHQKEWIQRNVLEVQKCASFSSSLNQLLDYCNNLMILSPEIVFKSDSLVNLPKETLIALLKNDELNMEEIDVWTSVMQWATKQVPGLINEPTGWSSEDFTKVRTTISDCIPHIRLFNISPEDFRKRVIPYDELLTKELRHDVLSSYLDKDYKPKVSVLPPRKGQATHKNVPNINVSDKEHKRLDINRGISIDSVIINGQQAAWISQKIMESSKSNGKRIFRMTMNNSFFNIKFTLLYRHSRDGGAFENFRQMCAEKGPTVAVGKVLDTDEILGGYNPIAWKSMSDVPPSRLFLGFSTVSTTESFIFSFKINCQTKGSD